eukprot:gene18697-21278_t
MHGMLERESFLLNLPVPIVAIICYDWLRIQDVSRLDTAFCQYETRAALLKIISSITMQSTCTYSDNFELFMQWVVRRHLNIDCLTIPRRAFPWKGETMAHFLKSVGHLLKTMNISYLHQTNAFFYSDISYYCKSLRELYARDSSTSSAAVRSVLMNCPHLVVLDINNFEQFHSHCLDGLKLPNLQVLRLQSCDEFICEILSKAAPNLHKLQICGFHDLDPADIQQLCEGCPHLHEVRLPRSYRHQDAGLDTDCVHALVTHCTRLEALDLSGQRGLNDTCFTNATVSFSTLRKLCIQFMYDLTDVALIQIAENCQRLQVLGCDGCGFSDVGLAAIAGRFPHLHTLYIGNHNHSTMAGYLAGLKNLPALVELGLYEFAVGDTLLDQIGTELPQLRCLELQSCFGYTIGGLISVAKQLKRIVLTAQSASDPCFAELSARYPRLDAYPATESSFTCVF